MKFEITKGKIPSAIRLVAYGAEGIGKSTFASKFPNPLFIDVEGGTHQLDVARFPKPENWHDLLEEIDAVIEEPNVCRTLVIDTIDRAETLLITQLLAEAGVDSIEKYGGGYGKGYTAIQERFNKDFLVRLDRLIAKRVNVVLLAHAAMRKLESPDDPPYDRWELKVSKKVAPLVKEWADILLFMNYEVMVIEENGRNKAKGKAHRKMHANHKPTYDAKNRYGLPDDMDLDFEPLRKIYDGTVPVQKEPSVLNVDTQTDIPVEGDVREDIRDELLRRLAAAGVGRQKFEAWLVATGRLAPGCTVYNLSGTQASAMLEHIDTLVNSLKGDN
ncbi:MAG: ATP-binding protein [Solobacterium sp.]|nr:ATP-binding protein [Solobacterium sp.]